MRKKIFILSCLAFLQLNLSAEKNLGTQDRLNPIITGVPMLSIAPDGRAAAMGDAGAATTADIFSQHWNPAKYAFMESSAGFALSYTPWLTKLVSDINLGYAVGYWKINELQAISASIKYFSLGSVTLLQHADDYPIEARPNDFSFDLAYSRKLSEKISAAVGVRYIRSDLDVKNNSDGGAGIEMLPANSIAVDVSAYYQTPISMQSGDANLAFGLNISNFGTKITYDESNYVFLPTNLKLGTSFSFPFDRYNTLSISADANKLLVPARGKMTNEEYKNISPLAGIFKSFSDADGGFKEELQEIMWSVGAEYVYNNQFFVRGGYQNQHELKGSSKYFTAGLGFKLNVFTLDVAYVLATAPSNPLDKTLRFSLSFDIFGLKALRN